MTLSNPVPENEKERLAALETYDVLGSPPEEIFDDLAELAAHICRCPVGQVNLVGDARRWTKGCYGLPSAVMEGPRSSSCCQWTVCQSDLLLISDMTLDERSRQLPYVAGPPYARFYAAMPLINPEGYALGTLCVVDFEPRQLAFEQTESLRRLARQAVAQLELRRQLIALRHAQLELAAEKQRADNLLLNILPAPLAEELKREQRVEPRFHGSVTIMFADFHDFTRFAETMEPHALIEDLDRYFCAFEEIAGRHRLEQLKTIGDAFMCVGGLPTENRTHPVDACLAALEIQAYMGRINAQRSKMRMEPWELRIGLHTGGVMAGVVGRRKFAYDVWGDAVNIAARMESSGEPGRVNLSESTWQRVKGLFEAEPRGSVAVKHKGDLNMFFLVGIRPELSRGGEGRFPDERFASARERLRV